MMVATSDDGLGRYLEPRTSDVLEYTARHGSRVRALDLKFLSERRTVALP